MENELIAERPAAFAALLELADAVRGLANMRFAVATARRGGAIAADVLTGPEQLSVRARRGRRQPRLRRARADGRAT